MTRLASLALTLPVLALAAAPPCEGSLLTQEDDLAYEIATEAYVYAYPMMIMELTRQVSTNVEAAIGPFAPLNQFAHMRVFPDHTFHEVVRPNVDTLYSAVWFDVSKEPLVLSIPEGTERYHMMPMLDMWTDVFACPGSRTNGPAGGDFAIVGPLWQGELPAGVEGIRSPTSIGWIIGRTQTNGPSDYETVHAIQDSYGLVPLSQFGKPDGAVVAGIVDASFDVRKPPLMHVEEMSAEEYFERFADLLVENPPHEMDWPILARLRRLGIVAGEPFEFSALDADVQKALKRGAERGKRLIADRATTAGTRANGWSISLDGMGTYGTGYLQRAMIARIGLGANLIEDALYPISFVDQNGHPYDGSHSYEIHFAADQLPPVAGFWSLTMYNDEMYLAENSIGRFAIGDRDELRYNQDGSLDILIQHEPPAEDILSNWLPAPPTRFDLVLRLYWPNSNALVGDWVPPAVTRVDETL